MQSELCLLDVGVTCILSFVCFLQNALSHYLALLILEQIAHHDVVAG